MEENLQGMKATIADAVSLSTLLDGMTKEEMIKYAEDTFALSVDYKLTKDVIKANIIKVDEVRRGQAYNQNAESTALYGARGDKAVSVRFHRLDFPDADLEFSYSGTFGMNGPKNRKGFSKCPSFHLFPGEVYTLPMQVIGHLKSLTFATHKAVVDQATGMIKGTIPVVKPRFILEYVLSQDQLDLIALSTEEKTSKPEGA